MLITGGGTAATMQQGGMSCRMKADKQQIPPDWQGGTLTTQEDKERTSRINGRCSPPVRDIITVAVVDRPDELLQHTGTWGVGKIDTAGSGY